MPIDPTTRHATVERLEPRQLLSTAFPNVDVSRAGGNEAEAGMAADPTTPGRLFVASNTDTGTAGLYAARSTDGGATWTGGIITDGTGTLPAACCDPSAAFDSFGNLFLCYIDSNQTRVQLLLSTDGGATFTTLANFKGNVDQPTLTTGPGSLWVNYNLGSKQVAAGAAVTALGTVAAFGPVQSIPGSTSGTFGDIAIGPDGRVAVTYQRGSPGKSKISVAVDPDGLGPAKFGKPVVAAPTRVGLFDYIPAQYERGIDAEAGLAFDRSTGPHRGRLYLVYTDAAPAAFNNTDVFLRYSDDGGTTWSNPARVNDDTGLAGQFLPRVATDDATGTVAVSWYDTRDDPDPAADATALRKASRVAARRSRAASEQGEGGEDEDHDNPRAPGDGGTRDPNPNPAADDAGVYVAVATPSVTGLTLSPNQRISDGLTNADAADNSIDLGDYTGLAFSNGTLYPAWSDNSNAAGHNPAGTKKTLDLYASPVAAANVPAPSRVALGGLNGGAGPVVIFSPAQYPAAKKTGRVSFKVVYASTNGIDGSNLDGTEMLVTGPNGFSQPARLLKAKVGNGTPNVTVSYLLINPGGAWAANQAGVYTITLADGRVKDAAGTAAACGAIGNFFVGL